MEYHILMAILYCICGGMIILGFRIVLSKTKKGKKQENIKQSIPAELVEQLKILWNKYPGYFMDLERIIKDYEQLADSRIKEDLNRNIRIRQNKEYDECLNLHNTDEEKYPTTKEGFMLWAVMTSNYTMERSLQMDGELQRICNKIAGFLTPEELNAIFQINRKVCKDAETLYIKI